MPPDDLWTPPYVAHRRFANGLEVRLYEPVVAAENGYALEPPAGATAAADSKASNLNVSGNAGGGGAGVGAFRALAGYIFGSNANDEKMAMTVPVASGAQARVQGGDTTMRFYLPVASKNDAPAPNDASVRVVDVPGGVFATVGFRGDASADAVRAASDRLLRLCREQNLTPQDGAESVELLAYNGPGTPTQLRRYEVRVPLEGFALP